MVQLTNEFAISGRKVGYEHPPLVIAEIGINHEGCLQTAFEMVDAAHLAGAEMIKHQTHVVSDEMSDEAKSVIPGNATDTIFEIMARCALSEDDEVKLKEYVEAKGLIFISTPFSREAALRLERMQVPAYKIGSGECNNYPLIELVASFGKPIILSTGMNTIDSIAKAVSIIEKHNIPYALLHCTNVYPTPYDQVRLGGMIDIQEAFPNAVVGLSDHTVDNYACLGAVALGASILERHFTDHKGRFGPDIICSMDAGELRELIIGSHALHQARGGNKQPSDLEQPTIDFAFASVVTTQDVRKGEILTGKNLWVKRPGTGDFLAEDYETLLGLAVSTDIPANTQLMKTHIKG